MSDNGFDVDAQELAATLAKVGDRLSASDAEALLARLERDKVADLFLQCAQVSAQIKAARERRQQRAGLS